MSADKIQSTSSGKSRFEQWTTYTSETKWNFELRTVKGDYTTRFGNFILYYNFLTNSLKFKMYTLSETEFHKEDNCDIIFLPKVNIFEKITKNTFFAIFLSKQATKNWNSTNWFGIVLLTWNIHLDVAFSHFYEFLLIFWVSCQIRQKFHFFTKFSNFFTLFGMKFKKSAKTRKNEKTQHLNGCFKSIKQFQSNF